MKRSEKSAQIAVRTIGNPKCLYHRVEDLLFVCKEKDCKESLVCSECINTLHETHRCVELHEEAKLKRKTITSYTDKVKTILPNIQKKIKLVDKTIERNEMYFRKIVKEAETLEEKVNGMKTENESNLNAYIQKLKALSRQHMNNGSGFDTSNNGRVNQWCPMNVPKAPALYNLNVKITSEVISKQLDSFGSCFYGRSTEKIEDSKVVLSINYDDRNCLSLEQNAQQVNNLTSDTEKEPSAKQSHSSIVERKMVLSCLKKGIKMAGQLIKGDKKFCQAIAQDIANVKETVARLEKRNTKDLKRYRCELQMKHDNLLSKLTEYMAVLESGTNVRVFDTAMRLGAHPDLPDFPAINSLHVKVSTVSSTHLNYICPVHKNFYCNRKDERHTKSIASSDEKIRELKNNGYPDALDTPKQVLRNKDNLVVNNGGELVVTHRITECASENWSTFPDNIVLIGNIRHRHRNRRFRQETISLSSEKTKLIMNGPCHLVYTGTVKVFLHRPISRIHTQCIPMVMDRYWVIADTGETWITLIIIGYIVYLIYYLLH